MAGNINAAAVVGGGGGSVINKYGEYDDLSGNSYQQHGPGMQIFGTSINHLPNKTRRENGACFGDFHVAVVVAAVSLC